jgi:protein SCO1/2
MARAAVPVAIVLLLAALAGRAFAQYNGVPPEGMMTKGTMPAGITPDELKKVSFDQELGAQVPLDLPFRDEAGRPVQLSRYFTGRPVILALVYYECPMLCVQALNGLVKALKLLALEPGRDYAVVTVSFNPAETPRQAAAKKDEYVGRLGRPGAAEAWHFLTGSEASIRVITGAVGFHYVYDAETRQFAHPTGLAILTPDGRVSKYIFGIDYGARDLRFALVEASDNKVGTPVDRLLLYCYHYDPASGKYGLVLLNVLRAGGVLTVAIIGGLVLLLRRREKRAAAGRGGPSGPGAN